MQGNLGSSVQTVILINVLKRRTRVLHKPSYLYVCMCEERVTEKDGREKECLHISINEFICGFEKAPVHTSGGGRKGRGRG